ncbi:MAG: hypothetical protein ACLPPF_11530 [Rhodomicrobium sp.]
MKRIGASLLLALALGAASGAAAAPLTHPDGLSEGSVTLVQHFRHHRRFGYRTWRGCPYWYERTFWGAYRLYSPCSNRLTTHAY